MLAPATTRLCIRAAQPQDLRAFAHQHRLDLCFGSIRETHGEFSLDAYVSPSQADILVPLIASAGLRHSRDESDAEVLEISTGNRFAAPGVIPHGVGEKK